jgi:integrase
LKNTNIFNFIWRSEIDLDKKIWTVPADRMKAGRQHRAPLSSRAVTIVHQFEKLKAGEFVFPSQTRSERKTP